MDLKKAHMACEDAMFSFSGEKWPVVLLFIGNRLALPHLKISLVFKIWEKTKDAKKKTFDNFFSLLNLYMYLLSVLYLSRASL